jgi:hypothetical protein
MGDARDTYIALVLFLLGAPALAFQIIGSEVRTLILMPHNRRLILRLVSPSAGGLFITILAFSLDVLIPDDQVQVVSILNSGLIAMMLALAGYEVWQMLKHVAKPLLVDELAGKCEREIAVNGGSVNQYLLDDLVLLGQESKAGAEKNDVIQAFARVIHAIVARPGYDRCRLSEIIPALRRVVLDGTQSPSSENVHQAVDILREVLHSPAQGSANAGNSLDPDLDQAFLLLSRLGQTAVELPGDSAALACVGALCDPGLQANPSATQSLCEIGAAALAHERILVAMQCLQYLDAIMFDQDGLPELKEISYDYIALLAVFFGHGTSGRRLARQYLFSLKDKPALDLDTLLNQAIAHHRQVNRLVTADRIEEMYAQLVKKVKKSFA